MVEPSPDARLSAFRLQFESMVLTDAVLDPEVSEGQPYYAGPEQYPLSSTREDDVDLLGQEWPLFSRAGLWFESVWGGQWTLNFDGSDTVVVPKADAPANIFDGGGTVEFWLNPRDSTIMRPLGKGSAWFILMSPGPPLTVNKGIGIFKTFSGTNGNWRTVVQPDEDEWVHVAIAYNADNASNEPTIYLNGDQAEIVVQSSPSGNRLTDPDNDLVFGDRESPNSAAPFVGELSDIRLWSDIRTAQEIADNYHKRLDGNEAGLAGYWPLYEGSTLRVLDKTSNAADGAISGATWKRENIARANFTPPKIVESNALDFDGDDDLVTVSDDAALDITSALTVEAWVKGTDDDTQRRVISKADAYMMRLNPTGEGGGIGGSGRFSGFITISGTAEPRVSTSFPADSWSHFAMVYNGSTLKLYKDGAEVDSVSRSGSIDTNANDLLFGGGGSVVWDGQITKVRVWNVERTAQEIAASYLRDLNGNEAGLAGYWPFDEGSGATVADNTSNGNDGTITGAAWVRDNVTGLYVQSPGEPGASNVMVAGFFTVSP
jgi:hypothetical protein